MILSIHILQKNELKLEDIDEVVILCPTSEGKMVKLKLIKKNNNY